MILKKNCFLFVKKFLERQGQNHYGPFTCILAPEKGFTFIKNFEYLTNVSGTEKSKRTKSFLDFPGKFRGQIPNKPSSPPKHPPPL